MIEKEHVSLYLEWSDYETPWERKQALKDALLSAQMVYFGVLNYAYIPWQDTMELLSSIPTVDYARVKWCFAQPNVIKTIRKVIRIIRIDRKHGF